MVEPRASELADIALALHDEPDTKHMIDRAVGYAKEATKSDGGGLLLLRGRNHLEASGSTHRAVEESDRLQATSGQGPAVGALHGRRVAMVDDTAADHQWPKWSPLAARMGVRSALSVRLSTAHKTIGSLNLYRRSPDRFGDRDVTVARTFAQHAAVALAAAIEEDGLRHAIGSHHTVGQAQGILMERFGLDADQAFAVLRRYSRDNNIKLRDIAEQVINTRQIPRCGAGT